MTGGDALVVDQMRSMDMVVQVGEEGLQEAQKAAQRLQAALQSQAKSLQTQDTQDTQNTQDTGSFEASTASTREVPKVCGDVELLKALDYPRLGDTYKVHLRPALLRRFEAVESDLLGEVRLGKTVTILKHGTESPGRVQVYTEDALVMPGSEVQKGFFFCYFRSHVRRYQILILDSGNMQVSLGLSKLRWEHDLLSTPDILMFQWKWILDVILMSTNVYNL